MAQASPPGLGAVDYFLKIDGIEGESQDAKHKDEIHIQSFRWGATNSGSHQAGGGGGAGKVVMQDFSFTAPVGKHSPKLMLACASGEHIKKAVLIARRAGKEQQEYLKYTFSDLLVSSFNIEGHDHEVVPRETFSLNFAVIEKEYKQQKADGTLAGAVKAGWKLKENAKV
jgi:type VI secretion system secreted protein Hcp